MTARTTAAALAATTTAVAVLLTGCSLGDADKPAPAPTTPAPTGTGPYTEPPSPEPAAPLSPGRSGTPKAGIPQPDDVDQDDATAVSKAALTALLTYDTELDTSRSDAGVRTAEAGWCTPKYAEQLREATTRADPGAEWNQWTTHRAYTTVTLQQTEEAGRPADTATTAYRQWTATITPRGRDGWKGEPTVSTVFAELTRAAKGQPWRLAAVQIQ